MRSSFRYQLHHGLPMRKTKYIIHLNGEKEILPRSEAAVLGSPVRRRYYHGGVVMTNPERRRSIGVVGAGIGGCVFAASLDLPVTM